MHRNPRGSRWRRRMLGAAVSLGMALGGIGPPGIAQAASGTDPVAVTVVATPNPVGVAQTVTVTATVTPAGMDCLPPVSNFVSEVDPGRQVAEVFTAPANLTLQGVVFYLAQTTTSANGLLDVSVVPWSTSTGPGTPLATATVSPTGVPSGQSGTDTVAVPISFAQPVALTAGSTYAVELSSSDDWWVAAATTSCSQPVTYANGGSGWQTQAALVFAALTTALPSGTVNFYQGQTLVGSASLTSGTLGPTASLSTVAPTASGPVTYTAEYTGDATFQAGSGSTTVSVQPGPATQWALAGPTVGGAGQVVGPYTVTLTDVYGNAAQGPVTATLSSSPGGLTFLDSNHNPITQVTVPAGQSQAQFWVEATTATTYTLTIQGPLPTASQEVSIEPEYPYALKVLGPTTWTVGQVTGPLTIEAVDYYGNPSPIPRDFLSNVGNGLQVLLSGGSPAVAVYGSPSGGAPLTAVTIPFGQAQVQVWAAVYQGGAYTLSAQESATDANLEPVNPGSLAFTASEAPALSFSPIGSQTQATWAVGQRIPLYVTAGADDPGPLAITVQGTLAGTGTPVGAVYTAPTATTPVDAVYAAPGTTVTAYYDPGPGIPPGPVVLTAQDLYGTSPPVTLTVPTAGPELTRTLEPGWNTWSVPFAVYNPAAPLAQWLSNPQALLVALTYDPTTGQWQQVTGATPPPMQGVYVDIAGTGPVTATVLPSSTPSAPPTWGLAAGWNLVGPSASSGAAPPATVLTGISSATVPLLVDPNTNTPMANPVTTTTGSLENGFAYWLYATGPAQLLGQLATPGTAPGGSAQTGG